MPKFSSSVIKKPLWQWIISGNTWLQGGLVLTAVLAAMANLLPLEMQKRIVNEAIDQSRIDLLVRYCGIYLASVITATALKYLISALQNIIGQNAIHEMRDALYRHILSLPLEFFRKTQPGVIVSALTTELATAGDFLGMAVAVPVTNLLMLAAFAVYLFFLNPLLAAISFGIYPIFLFIMPVLQKKVNHYNKKRVDATRKMSGKAGETVSGIHEIHAGNTFDNEGNVFEKLVKKLRRIRIIWNLYRQAVKRANSLFVNFSRFLIFALGGWLAIHGRLELGALVAFISAQDKLYDPWKELIVCYQAYQTAQVTYDRTMSYFNYPLDSFPVVSDNKSLTLRGDISVNDMNFITRDGKKLLSKINFDLKHGRHAALVGFSGSGKSTLVKCIGQLYPYTSGSIRIDDKEVSRMSKADIANTIGFVSQEPFIFDGSIRENLIYAFRAKNAAEQSNDSESVPGLDDQIQILQQTGLFVDVLGFGLSNVLNAEKHKDLVHQILKLRKTILSEHRDELSDFIEFYDPDKFLYYSTISENLIYGESELEPLNLEKLIKKDSFLTLLDQVKLKEPLAEFGINLISSILVLYDNQTADREDSEYLDLISEEEIDKFKKIYFKVKHLSVSKIKKQTLRQILQVVLNFNPRKHDFLDLPDSLAEKIVKNRSRFKKLLMSRISCQIKPCGPHQYLYSRSIMTNILYGNIHKEKPGAQEKILTLISRLLIAKDLLEMIMAVGLQYKVGSKGSNLSGGQKQKLAIARALMKKPAILILDEATSGLDNKSQSRFQRLLETQWQGKSTVLAVVHRLDIIKNYDKIAVMKAGKIVETGTYDELMEKRGSLYDLVNSKQ